MMSQQSLPSRALRVMLELSPTAQIFHVVTSGYDGTARVWRPGALELLRTLPLRAPCRGLALDTDFHGAPTAVVAAGDKAREKNSSKPRVVVERAVFSCGDRSHHFLSQCVRTVT